MIEFSVRRCAAVGSFLVLAALPGLANAQIQGPTGEGPGFYVGAEGGGVFGGDDEITGGGIDTRIDHHPGLGLLGQLGFRFDNGIRVEFEAGYRRENIEKAGGIHQNSTVDAINFGPNVLYDIRTGSPLTPYLGLGVGGAEVGYRRVNLGGGDSLDSRDLGFAYQGILGVAYALSDRLQAIAEYRYMRALPISMTTTAGAKVDVNYHAHTVLVGLRWMFYPMNAQPAPPPKPTPVAAPMPMPVPKATPAPVRAPTPTDFTVYFEYDSAAVTGAAAETVRHAADAIKANRVARITVTGHTDLSGSEQYNQRLSLRRAAAVKAALMRLGVPGDSIAVMGKDGENPVVPTPIGVREPKNRRAEIVF